MFRMHNSAAPYYDKLPNAGRGCKYMKCNTFLVTANNQLTINPKYPKKASLGSRPESIITFQDLRFYQCRHLVSFPKW